MRTPDFKAPRFRYKVRNILNRKLFDKFREKHPEYSDYTNEQFYSIIKTYCLKLRTAVVTTRDGIEFSDGLGILFVGMCPNTKRKERGIDWSKSNKLGIKVKYRNHETDGKMAKLYYSNYNCKIKLANRQMWKFTAVRQFKKEISIAAIKNHRIFVSVDSHKDSWLLLDNRRAIQNLAKKQKKEIITYNEFDFN